MTSLLRRTTRSSALNTLPLCIIATAGFHASSAHATEPEEESSPASVSVDASASTADKDAPYTEADKEAQRRLDRKWIRRWAPEKNMMEVGIYGGAFITNDEHELYGADNTLGPDQGWLPYRKVNGDIGARFAYMPLRHFGLEVEGGLFPLGVEGGSNALGLTGRGHLIGQLGLWSITPFVVLGAGALGVTADAPPDSVGRDVDPSMHYGGGVKIFINRHLQLRVDGRGILSFTQGTLDESQFKRSHAELLLGLSATLGREKERAGEGPKDTDGDGILDPDDACVTEPGVPEYDGCPIPDTDGDGILDPDDRCPKEPGVPEFEGCPIPDTDGDGILDPDDQCVEEPETANSYQDEDGCPDEIPEEIKKFTGVIEGIYFDTSKDTIKSKSERVLKKALKVLEDFPDVRLTISGHTDSRGDYDMNMDLSRRRAESVRQWMVDHGIDGARFETAGFGPDKPIDTNDTRDGRAKNRRIEFSLLK